MNSDNGLTLAFNNSPAEMTGDKNMPLDTIISATYSRNYNSASSTGSEAAFFPLICLIFSSVFPWKINFWICKQKIIKLKILKSKRMKFDLQMTNHHVFWHTSSIHRISPNEWKLPFSSWLAHSFIYSTNTDAFCTQSTMPDIWDTNKF